MNKVSNRFYHIDLLEVIAMLFVIIYHSMMYPSNFINDIMYLLFCLHVYRYSFSLMDIFC